MKRPAATTNHISSLFGITKANSIKAHVMRLTNAIGLADVGAVQALVPDFPLLVVEINPAGGAVSASDLRLTGQEPEETVIERVTALLLQRLITQ